MQFQVNQSSLRGKFYLLIVIANFTKATAADTLASTKTSIHTDAGPGIDSGAGLGADTGTGAGASTNPRPRPFAKTNASFQKCYLKASTQPALAPVPTPAPAPAPAPTPAPRRCMAL